MNLFIVRDTKTEQYLTPIRGGKSSTTRDLGDKPRTFTTRYAAESAARWWAAGYAGMAHDWESGDPVGVNSVSVEGRNLNTLRVHKFNCVRGPGRPIRPIGGTK